MAQDSKHRFVLVFTGSGQAADAVAHVVAILEEAGHDVELVSYGGLAARTARTIAARGLRGLKAAVNSVTGALTGDDPLGLAEKHGKFDVVVATDPDLVSATKGLGPDILRVGLTLDLVWRPSWLDSDADALIVPHAVFRALAVRRGMPEEAVFTAGVPLSRAFSRTLDVEKIREKFGLRGENGVPLMVLAAGMDEVRLERLVFQLSLLDRATQPIFYVGDDQRAAKSLRKAAGEYGVLARMFGEVDNIEEYYAASDLVVAEVQSALVLPMLALDKPVILVDQDVTSSPIGAFLEDESAALLVPDILRLGAEIEAVLADEKELARLRKGAGQVVDQQGAQKVADALIEAAENAAGLRAASRTEEAAATEEKTLSGGGAFEVIGTGSAPPPPARDNLGEAIGGRPPIAERARQYEHRTTRRLSRAEAKEEMAALILMERDVEKRLGDATRYVSQWEGRLDLARQAAEPELAAEAQRFLDTYRKEETGLLRELDRIRSQKDKLKRRVGGGSAPGPTQSSAQGPDVEHRFRSMELDRDLTRLKDRVRDEFGDDDK